MIKSTHIIVFVVLIVCSLLTKGQNHKPSAPSSDSFYRLRSVTEQVISNRGNAVFCLIENLDIDKNVHQATLALIDIASSQAQVLLKKDGYLDHLSWSKSDRFVYFLEDSRTGKRLVRMGLREKKVVSLSPGNLDVLSYKISNIGRIAIVAREPQQRSTERLVFGGESLQPAQIWVSEISGLSKFEKIPFPENIDYIDWSPNGEQLVFSHRPSATPHDLAFNSDLSVLSVRTGKIRTLVERPGMDVNPSWSPDGQRIAFLSHDNHEDYLGSTYLCIVSAEGGVPVNISSKIHERIIPVATPFQQWNNSGSAIYFSVPDRLTRTLYKFDLSGNVLETFSAEQEVDFSFSFQAHGNKVTYLTSNPLEPWKIMVADSAFHQKRVLFKPNQNDFQQRYKDVHWRAPDGQELEGILFEPERYDGKKPHALLAYLHGGPSSGFGWAFSPQVNSPDLAQIEPFPPHIFVSAGYLVFMPNPRGSGGYGQEFMKANVGNSPETEVRDVLAGVGFLIKIGIADSNKIGIMGWSAGGEESGAAIKDTNLFKAAVLGAATVDAAAEFGTQRHPDLTLSYYKGAPWEVPELYMKMSTIFHANRIKTPTLIVHGVEDASVPVGQAKELYRALSCLHVPVQLVMYPGQNHNFSDPQFMKDVAERSLHWFLKWMAPN